MNQTEDWGSEKQPDTSAPPQLPAPTRAAHVEQAAFQTTPETENETSEFPMDLKKSLVILQKAAEEWENAPILPLYKTVGQKLSDGRILAIRREAQQKLKRIQAHVFKLQQGMQVVQIN